MTSRMNIGLFSSTIDGSLDGVVADAARAERDGFASYWVPQIFGPDRSEEHTSELQSH